MCNVTVLSHLCVCSKCSEDFQSESFKDSKKKQMSHFPPAKIWFWRENNRKMRLHTRVQRPAGSHSWRQSPTDLSEALSVFLKSLWTLGECPTILFQTPRFLKSLWTTWRMPNHSISDTPHVSNCRKKNVGKLPKHMQRKYWKRGQAAHFTAILCPGKNKVLSKSSKQSPQTLWL